MIDLTQLDPEFADLFGKLLFNCAARGAHMRALAGLRPPIEQGKLWRQSRLTSEITAKVSMLRANAAPFLAQCLERADPTNGPWATNAIPGLSWHQFGLAADCVWILDGEPEWSASKGDTANGYRIYGEEAMRLGMRTLASIGDAGHVQMPLQPAPDKKYTLVQIDAMMKEKFGP